MVYNIEILQYYFVDSLGNFEGLINVRSAEHISNNLRDASATWDALDWLRSITKLPIVLKGILTGKLLDNNSCCSSFDCIITIPYSCLKSSQFLSYFSLVGLRMQILGVCC